MDSMDIFALADQLLALREDKARLEERVKKINGFIDEVDYKLSEAMADTETKNFTRGEKTFYLTSRTYASAVAATREALFDILRERGFDGLITETIHANTLASFVKEQIDENGDALPEWLDGFVNVHEKTSVGVRKATKKER